MKNSNIVLLKLLTGESILGTIDKEQQDNFLKQKIITIENPVQLNLIRMPNGTRLMESYILIPWFPFTTTEVYKISADKVITIIDVDDTVKKNYFQFLENRKEDDENTDENEDDEEELSEDVSMDQFLESFIENTGEYFEEENEGRDDSQTYRIRRGTRTLH